MADLVYRYVRGDVSLKIIDNSVEYFCVALTFCCFLRCDGRLLFENYGLGLPSDHVNQEIFQVIFNHLPGTESFFVF